MAVIPLVFGEAYLDQHSHALDKMVHAIAIRNHRHALIAHMESQLDYPHIQTFAGHVRSPSLMITGADDTMVTSESARNLAERLKAVHHELTGIGHMVPVEAPGQFLALTQSFLSIDAH